MSTNDASTRRACDAQRVAISPITKLAEAWVARRRKLSEKLGAGATEPVTGTQVP